MSWKIATRADGTVGEVAPGTEKFQNKPCEDEQSSENGVEDEEDQGRSVYIEAQGNLCKSEKEETAPKPMVQHRVEGNSLSELFGTAPANESAEKSLEDDSDI